MTDEPTAAPSIPQYAPDIAREKRLNMAKVPWQVDKPIRLRVVMRPATKQKHYRKKARNQPQTDRRNPEFY